MLWFVMLLVWCKRSCVCTFGNVDEMAREDKCFLKQWNVYFLAQVKCRLCAIGYYDTVAAVIMLVDGILTCLSNQANVPVGLRTLFKSHFIIYLHFRLQFCVYNIIYDQSRICVSLKKMILFTIFTLLAYTFYELHVSALHSINPLSFGVFYSL